MIQYLGLYRASAPSSDENKAEGKGQGKLAFASNVLANQLMAVTRKVSGANRLLKLTLENFISKRCQMILCLHYECTIL